MAIREYRWTKGVAAIAAAMLVLPVAADQPVSIRPPSHSAVATDWNTDTTDGLASLAPSGMAKVSAMGSAQYQLPIWTPRGRGRVGLSLALRYDSRQGNGLVGVGWSLNGLSVIERCPRAAALDSGPEPVAFEDDEFRPQLCLDGKFLVPADIGSSRSPGTRPFVFEEDDGSRIYIEDADEYGPYYFERWRKDGLIEIYGDNASPDALLEGPRVRIDPDRSLAQERYDTRPLKNGRFRWSLSEIRDRDGNTLRIEYDQRNDGGAEQWPTRISYTGSSGKPSTKPLREVKFVYEPRPDPEVAYVSGLRLQNSRRLSAIQVIGPNPRKPELLREYRLGYRQGQSTGRSVLKSVTDCDGKGVCSTPTEMAYTAGPQPYRRLESQVRDIAPDPGATGLTTIIRAADFNGDGRDDMLYRAGVSGEWRLRISTGTIFADAVTAGLPPDPPCGRQHARAMTIGDTDNDGSAEVIYPRFYRRADGFGQTAFSVYAFNGSNLSQIKRDLVIDQGPEAVPHLIDLTGDKSPDLLVQNARLMLETTPYRMTLRSNHEGVWGALEQLNFGQATVDNPISRTGQRRRFHEANVTDLNGSGKLALLVPAAQSDYYHALTLENGQPVAHSTPSIRVAADRDYIFLDVNGDRLPDVTNLLETGSVNPPHHYVNTGSGFKPENWNMTALFLLTSDSEVPSHPCVQNTLGRETQVFDFDGDNRQDIAAFNNPPDGIFGFRNDTVKVFQSTGSGFKVDDLGIRTGQASAYGRTMSGLLDVNGDGLSDFYQVEQGRLVVYLREGQAGDLLETIEGAAGSHTEFAYRPMSDRSVYLPSEDCGNVQACMVRGAWLVSQLTEDNGETFSAAFDRRFQYVGARIDLNGRASSGMEKIVVHDPVSNTKVTTFFDNKTVEGPTAIHRMLARPIRISTETLLDDQRKHILDQAYSYEFMPSSNGQYYVLTKQQSITSEYERSIREYSGGLTKRSTQRNYFDRFGNVTLHSEAWESERKRDHIELREYRIGYQYDFPNWLISEPDSITADNRVDGVSTGKRTAAYAYDIRGHLITVVTEPDATDPAVQTVANFDYDKFGRLTDRTDGAGPARHVHIDYDPNLDDDLPIAITGPTAKAKWTATYHSGYALPLTERDPNLDLTSYGYDGFGRLRAQASPAMPTVELHYLPGRATGQSLKITKTMSNGPTWSQVIDTRGRVTYKELSVGMSERSTEAIRYDGAGQIGTRTTTTSGVQGARTASFRYDPLGRLTAMKRPEGGKVAISYDGTTTDIVASTGQRRRLVSDGLGRTSTIADLADPQKNRWVTTDYQYGPFDQLAAAQTRTSNGAIFTNAFTYDAIGRRLDAIENGRVVERLTYDQFGDVKTRARNGEVTEIDRDILGRPVRELQAGRMSTYEWDTAPHGIGLLARATSADQVQTDFEYGVGGKPTRVRWVVDGASYATETSYDATGRPTRLACTSGNTPIRQSFALDYTPSGHLWIVSDAKDHGRRYWVGTDWADGIPQHVVLSNGLISEQTINQSGLTGRLQTNSSSSIEQNEVLRYDSAGRLTRRADSSLSSEYAYDVLGRLYAESQAHPDHAPDRSLTTYDDLGRVQRASGSTPPLLGTMSWGYLNPRAPFAVSRITVKAPQSAARHLDFSYNVHGEQTKVRSSSASQPSIVRTTSWRDGRPASMRVYDKWPYSSTPSKNWTQVGFLYDALGSVVKRTFSSSQFPNSTDSAVTLGEMLDVRSVHGTTTRRCGINLPGRTRIDTQIRQGATSTLYSLANWRGDVTSVYDDTGKPVLTQDFSAFGTRTATLQAPGAPSEGGVLRGLHGEIEDASLEVVTLGARVYDPLTRQFLSRDMVLNLTAGIQSANPYSYARNDPINFSDASGMQPQPTEPDALQPGDGWITTVIDDEGKQAQIEFLPGWFEIPGDVTGVTSEVGLDLSLRGSGGNGVTRDSGDGLVDNKAREGKPVGERHNGDTLQSAIYPWAVDQRGDTIGADLGTAIFTGSPRPTTWLDALFGGYLVLTLAPLSVGMFAIEGPVVLGIGSVYIPGISVPLTSGEAGAVIGWGTGQSAEAVLQTQLATQGLTREIVRQMVSRGLTRQWVQTQIASYEAKLAAGGMGLANTQLLPRLALMRQIVVLWPN